MTSEYEALSRLQRALASRYVIKQEIGRGGSAIVFLARDLKHDRNVAIKLLHPEFSALLGTERFLQEIRVAATLQHPHILPLYDSGEAEGVLYYVMPYVEGESLRQRLEREHQLPVDDSVSLTRKVASALDHAHRHGVIHRDIKPGNILLYEGEPLVADFGIALAITNAGGERLTETGIIVGTPQYMSPEQATNERTLGPQSDIYSLAAVAYEMLVGEPPVTGPSSRAVIARVLVDSPRRIRTVRKAVPVPVEAAILKALEKTPADRFRTAAEFSEALSQPSGSILIRRPGLKAIRIAGIIGSAIVVAIFVVANRRSQPASAPPVSRQVTYSGKALSAAISPDGQFLAYAIVDGDSLHVVAQDLGSGGTPNTIATITDGSTMEWSPDGTQILFGGFDAGRSRGLVFTVPRSGGQRRSVRLAGEMGANVFAYWVPDSLSKNSQVSLHTDADKRVLVVDLRTEDTVAIPVRGDYDRLFVGSWSPSGHRFAVTTKSGKPVRWAIRIAGRDGLTEVAVEDSIVLGSPRWSPTGDAVYYGRGSTSIWRVPVSSTTGKSIGAPEEIHGQLEILLKKFIGQPDFTVTRDGRRMAYANGRRYSNLWMVEMGRASRTVALTNGTALRWSPVVSPDGRWIAFAQEAAGAAELFRMPIEGGAATQITFGARVSPPASIAWSPDGRSIAFGSLRQARLQVWVATIENGQTKVLDRTNLSPYTGHLAWAPSSRVAYLNSDHTHVDLVDPASGDVRTIVPPAAWSVLQSPQYSPDGNKLAVAWNRGAGDFGVWIFDLTGSSPEKKIADGWLWPSGWSADGRYVYASLYFSPTVYRLDTRGQRAPEAILTTATAWRGFGQNAPVREMQCTPAGRLKPNAFVCAAFDFVSDIWIIDNFEQARD